ncbi:MAG: exo-alpha-sialidase [Acidobacteria bacterium]|nr:exo-alpha-sialidase [Acidobacteriota bacterium]
MTGTIRTKWSAFLPIIGIAALTAARAGTPALAQSVTPPPAACAEAPHAPEAVTSSVEVARLTLTWRAPAQGCAPESYIVEAWCDCVSNGFVQVPTRTADTTYTLDGLPSDAYRIQVRAVNAAGKSTPSNEVRFAVPRWGEHHTPDVVVAARTAERSTFFPTVARLKNGHLVTVYYDSPDHISPLGRIAMVRSTDDGRHWSTPRVAIDTPNDDRDPSVVALHDGTLLLSFFEVDRAQAPATQLGVFVARSRDEGATWSAPARVDTPPGHAATSAPIVELENGDLLLPYYGSAREITGTNDSRAAVIRSTDRGVTWPAGGAVVVASQPGIDFSEPAIADLGGGRLVAVIRAERGELSAFWTRSDDGGHSWLAPERLDIPAQAPDLLPVRVAGDARARVVLAYGELSQKFGEGRRTVMQLYDPYGPYGPGGSVQYAGPKVIYHGHCRWGDESYPSTVRISETRLFTVYYDACAGIIGGTFSNLSDLLEVRVAR